MIDKEEQRRRAAQLDAERQALGLSAPKLDPIKVVAPAPAPSWPFAQPAPAPLPVVAPAVPKTFADVIIPVTDKRHPQHKEWKKMQPTKTAKKKYLEQAFTNEIGQVIQPGSKIVAVRQGYNHSVKVAAGKYLGLRLNSNGSVRSVTILVDETVRGYQINGKRAGYNAVGATYGTYRQERVVTLPRKRIYAIV